MVMGVLENRSHVLHFIGEIDDFHAADNRHGVPPFSCFGIVSSEREKRTTSGGIYCKRYAEGDFLSGKYICNIQYNRVEVLQISAFF
jgi:hypothetical protein